MTDHDALHAALRSVARRLDEESDAVDAGSAALRPSTVRPRRRRALIAVAAVVLVVAGAVGALQLVDDAPRRVRISDTPSSEAPRPATSSPATTEPTTYEGTPPGALPNSGIAVIEGDRLVILDDDGVELGRATGPVTSQLGASPGAPPTVAVLRGTSHFAVNEPDPAEAPSGCEGAAGSGGVRTSLCGGAPQKRQQVVRVGPTGQIDVLAEQAPGSGGVGHWRWAVPSPDGRWVLAQWSGECEVPAAFLIPTEGGELRTVDGATGFDTALESTGAGWTPDGRAVVQFHEGQCGGGVDEPGTYVVDPSSGERTLVRAASDPSTRTAVWRQELPGNAPERSFARAIAELGLEGCCGEPSHGGPAAAAGAVWEGTEIPVSGGPSLAGSPSAPFDDTVTSSEAIDIDGVPATAGETGEGAFVAFTCGANRWTFGGGGHGDRTTAGAVRSFAEALIPHLYCTVGPPPEAPVTSNS